MQKFASQIAQVTVWREDALVVAIFASTTLDIAIQQLGRVSTQRSEGSG